MTERNDDYYQPWLRDPAPTPPKDAKSPATGGLAKPPPDAPLGVDVTAYPVDEPTPLRAAKPARPHQKAASEALSALTVLRSSAERFADWTIAAGERADIPAKVERLELPRRARELGQGGGAMALRAGRGIGSGTAVGWAAIVRATAKGWQRLALPTHVARAADGAKAGLEIAADKTRSGLGSAAKAGIAGVSEAAGKAKEKLRPGVDPAEPPPSGLDQLLEREKAAAPSGPAGKSAPDLPLFAADSHPSVAAPANKKAEAAGVVAAPPAAAQKTDPVAAATRSPQSAATALLAKSPPIWWLAAGASTLAAVFWIGTMAGGGMSKSEVETVVGDYIMANPQIIPQAMERFRANETAAAIDAIRPAIEKPYSGAWAGNANGDVTVTVFTDYGCVFCRASVPDIDRLLREDSGVKVVYRELPIIAPQSRDAAIMALRAARQGKYDAFHHAMFAAGSLDGAAIAAAARKAGLVTDGSADATGSAAVLQRELDSNLAIAQQLRLNATPTWIIGDQLLQGAIGYDGLTAAVAKARKAQN